MNKTTIETVSGKFVDLADPKSETIDIHDIAWSLSRMPRFVGHTITETPYSVAQHCCFVADQVRKVALNDNSQLFQEHLDKLSLYALLHDASESYTSDLPGPLKHIPELRPVIKAIEHKLDVVIFKALDLELPTDDQEKIIKSADYIAQKIEGHAFMESRGKYWNLPEVSIEELQKFEAPLSNLKAYHRFLNMFNKYNNKMILK